MANFGTENTPPGGNMSWGGTPPAEIFCFCVLRSPKKIWGNSNVVEHFKKVLGAIGSLFLQEMAKK